MKVILLSCAWFISCVQSPRYYLVDAEGHLVNIFSDPISCEDMEEMIGGTCYTVQ